MRARRGLVVGLSVCFGFGLGGCVERGRPYRFRSPMLARADLPSEPFPEAAAASRARGTSAAAADRPAPRVVSAPPIREASAAAADEITREAAARGLRFSRLAAPHRTASEAPRPALRTPEDLRTFVGLRDKRDPIAVALAWARELGTALATTDDSGPALIAWADANQRLGARTAPPAVGDLLVFDRTTSAAPADLVALVIARDARGVVELVYLGNGVVRRGFLDATRATLRRDGTGEVVNTILRHGRRPPPAGTRYLAGELLAHVVRVQ